MDSAISLFFKNLAWRLGKENDLSDITWAMCQASQTFFTLWMHFFFPDLDVSMIDGIEREVPDECGDGSRVDFFIRIKDDKPYLIEVKISDQNHHFGQYEKAYGINKERLGYITNYPLQKEGYEVKQWKEFYKYLKDNLSVVSDEDATLISAYCNYLTQVCSMIVIDHKIDLEKMTSLYDLTVLSRELADISCDEFKSSHYNTNNRDNVRWIYLGVDYRVPAEWRMQYPFIGILFSHPTPRICAGFDKRQGWSKTIVDFMKSNASRFHEIQCEFCTEPNLEDGEYYFYLKDEMLKRFKNAEDVETQKNILRNFIKEVLIYPVRLYNISSKA